MTPNDLCEKYFKHFLFISRKSKIYFDWLVYVKYNRNSVGIIIPNHFRSNSIEISITHKSWLNVRL